MAHEMRRLQGGGDMNHSPLWNRERRRQMMHHYISKYWENGIHYAEAWIQINLFGRCFCFSKRKIEI
jgi:hypothetical protein